MVTDKNGKEIRIGDLVKYTERSGETFMAKVTDFYQGGDEQYVKLNDGKLKGEWQVERVYLTDIVEKINIPGVIDYAEHVGASLEEVLWKIYGVRD